MKKHIKPNQTLISRMANREQ